MTNLPARLDSALALPDPDEKLISLWLHGRAVKTQRAYRGEITRFRLFTRTRLAELTLGELQDYAAELDARGLAPSTRARALAALKSLLSFGARIGVLPVDVGRPIKLPKIPNDLAERILSEEDVRLLLQSETDPRNRVLLRLLYYGGLRVSEAVGLRWRNCQPRTVKGERTGQVSIFGKGGKSRVVLLPGALFHELQELRGKAPADAPVFVSQKHTPLSSVQAWRIVKAAAKRAELDERISCHWLRHACASHSLHAGATIDVVAASLGHSSIAVTSKYLHAMPDSSAGRFLPQID